MAGLSWQWSELTSFVYILIKINSYNNLKASTNKDFVSMLCQGKAGSSKFHCFFNISITQVVTEINGHRDKWFSEFFKSKWSKE